MLKRKFLDNDGKDEDDLDIYARQIRETLLEDDELSPIEEAFMNGYEDSV